MITTSLRLGQLDPQVALADILVGAACSDDFFAAGELVALVDIMQQVVDNETLPDLVSLRIQSGEPLDTDEALFIAVNRLGDISQEQRMAVVAVVAKLVESDDVVHHAEERYLQRLERALGLAAPPPLPPPV